MISAYIDHEDAVENEVKHHMLGAYWKLALVKKSCSQDGTSQVLGY